MPIRCEIVSQDRTVYEGDVDMVILPGSDGEMGILPNHAPVLSTLAMGVIKINQNDEEHIFTVTGGVAEVQPKIVTVLADAAEHIDEIDIARAEEAKQRAAAEAKKKAAEEAARKAAEEAKRQAEEAAEPSPAPDAPADPLLGCLF